MDTILNIKKGNNGYIRSRANDLLTTYRYTDKIRNLGKSDITIDDYIRLCSNGCVYCGEKDFNKLGLDRIDTKKPHTKENCVCSCWKCNNEKGWKEHKKCVVKYTKNLEYITEYNSLTEASEDTKIKMSCISDCCRGKQKTAGGFIWKYK